ncbi:MAG: PAS domain S-box protein [Candidatus Cloacimonetes bacterium]|nr:PAS domain S-box protein [Candidatus Cloacimonadota bacterium]
MQTVGEETLSLLLQDSHVVLIAWSDNPDEPVAWVSPGVTVLTGYPAKSFLEGDLHLTDLVHPEERKLWERKLAGLAKDETDDFLSLRLRHREGHSVFVRVRVIAVPTDGRLRYFASLIDYSEVSRLSRRLDQSTSEHDRLMEQRADELNRAGVELDIEVNERLLAEKELRRSIARFSAVLENASGVAIMGFDRKSRVQYWNDASSRLYGITRENALGEPVHDLLRLSAVDRREFLSLVKRMIKTGEASATREWDVRQGDGRMLRIFSAMFPIREQNEVREILCMNIDVTAQRDASEQLRVSRQFFDDILNALADPVFVKDEQHNWILLNDALCSFMGVSREDLIGKTDYDYFPREQADVFWEKDDQVFQSGKANENIEDLTNGDGELHVISTKKTLLTDPKTGRKTLVGTIRDITESKRIEYELAQHRDNLQQLVEERSLEMNRSNHELKNQYRFLQSLLDQLPHPVFYKDASGVFLGCNRELELLLGHTREEIVGRSIFDLQPRHLAEEFHQHDLRLLKTKHQEYESRVVRADGREIDMRISKSVFYNVDGSLGGLVGVMVDVSQHKKDMQALKESFTKLEQAQDEIIRLDRQASIMAMAITTNHEINQPLMVLRGNMDMLHDSLVTEDNQLNERQNHYFERINGALDAIHAILDKFRENDLFHFERYVSGAEMVVFDSTESEEGED